MAPRLTVVGGVVAWSAMDAFIRQLDVVDRGVGAEALRSTAARRGQDNGW
jgi:hypothetical protein